MMLIVLPVELKPGPDADRIFAEVKDALRTAAKTYTYSDPLGHDLQRLADSARLVDLEAMRDTTECEPPLWRAGYREGYNAALADIAKGGGK